MKEFNKDIMRIRITIGDVLFMACVIMFVALPNVSFPYSPQIKGLLAITFFSYMMINKINSRWQVKNGLQLIWAILFLLLCYISKYWAYNAKGIDDIFNNVLWSFLMGCGACVYIQYYSLSIKDVAKRFEFVSLIFLINVAISGRFSAGRFSLSGVNENQFGIAVAGMVCFLLIYAKNCKWKNYLLDIEIIALTAIGVLSGSRVSLLTLGIYYILIIFYESPTKNVVKSIVKIIGIILLVMTAFYCIMNIDVLYSSIGVRVESLLSFLNDGSTNDGSAITRSNMISISKEIFKANPLLGIGLNNFKYLTYYNTYAHSNIYELASGLGIVGLIIYYVPLVLFLIKSYKAWWSNYKEAVIPMAILVAFLVGDIGHVSYFNYSQHIFTGIALGMLYKNSKKQTME